jgi:hypothetical protein
VPDSSPTEEKFVWQTLQNWAEEQKKLHDTNAITSQQVECFDYDLLMNIVMNSSASVSDFELFCFILRWCHANDFDLTPFVPYIDFGKFNVAQLRLAVDNGIPLALAFNALNKSKLLKPEWLHLFSLNVSFIIILSNSTQEGEGRWKFYYRAQRQDFHFYILRTVLQDLRKKFIVIKFPDDTVIGLYVGKRITAALENDVAFQVTAFYFALGKAKKIVLTQGYRVETYKMIVQDELIQLYQGEKANSFIWIGKKDLLGNDDIQISIDLNRFDTRLLPERGPIRKMRFSEIEIFVQDTTWKEELVVSDPDELLAFGMQCTLCLLTRYRRPRRTDGARCAASH